MIDKLALNYFDTYFPKASPSSIVSGKCWSFVSGRSKTRNPAINETAPNVIPGIGL